MTHKIVVLGAGPGGYVAAIRAARLGGDVTIHAHPTLSEVFHKASLKALDRPIHG